jgi:hypothetical protein
VHRPFTMSIPASTFARSRPQSVQFHGTLIWSPDPRRAIRRRVACPRYPMRPVTVSGLRVGIRGLHVAFAWDSRGGVVETERTVGERSAVIPT